jgi:hypothetical protein
VVVGSSADTLGAVCTLDVSSQDEMQPGRPWGGCDNAPRMMRTFSTMHKCIPKDG